MYKYGNQALIPGDKVHNEIVDSITCMERRRGYAILGLTIFWLGWVAGVVWWVMTYVAPFFS